jgi:hypothetical protein
MLEEELVLTANRQQDREETHISPGALIKPGLAHCPEPARAVEDKRAI